MRKLAIAFFIGLISVSSLTARDPSLEQVADVLSAPRKIQVLLQRDATEALLEVKGPYLLFNPQDGAKICSGLLGKRFMVHALPDGLKWGEEFPGIYQFAIQPRGENSSIFVNGIQYQGTLFVYSIGNQIHLVNEIDIESYVKSVLALQFTAPLESEVMAALAILERTNAYYATTRNRDVFWHLQAKDSGYQGAGLCAPGSPADRAADQTKNLVLVRSFEGKSLPFAAAWTEHSAGKTVPYQTIFRKEVFSPFPVINAPHAGLDRKETKWTASISKKILSNLLGVREIKDFELFVDSESNKVYGARVKDTQASLDFDFLSLQEKLGKERLKSSDFTVSIKDDTVVFSGFGRGHGVGLCLYSASAMAQNGDHAIKILSKFFPETFLVNLNALPRQKEGKRL